MSYNNGIYIVEKQIIVTEKVKNYQLSSDIDSYLDELDIKREIARSNNESQANNKIKTLLNYDSVRITQIPVETLIPSLKKLPPYVTDITLYDQSTPKTALPMPHITHLTLKKMFTGDITLDAPMLKYLKISGFNNLRDFEFIQNFTQLEHLEIVANNHLKSIVLPDSIIYASFNKTPHLTSIQATSSYGLPNIKTLIISGNGGIKVKKSAKGLKEIPLDMPNLRNLHLESIWRTNPDYVKSLYPTDVDTASTSITTTTTDVDTASGTAIISVPDADISNTDDTDTSNDVVDSKMDGFDLPNSLAKLEYLTLIGFNHINMPEDLTTHADLKEVYISHLSTSSNGINGFYPRLAILDISYVNIYTCRDIKAPNVIKCYVKDNYGSTNEWMSKWTKGQYYMRSLEIDDNYVSGELTLDIQACRVASIRCPNITDIYIHGVDRLLHLIFIDMNILIKNKLFNHYTKIYTNNSTIRVDDDLTDLTNTIVNRALPNMFIRTCGNYKFSRWNNAVTNGKPRASYL